MRAAAAGHGRALPRPAPRGIQLRVPPDATVAVAPVAPIAPRASAAAEL
ncbi:MAG: TMAO reductase system periplasmic protein TorT, partial [Proteobacteria bacterium]